MTTKSYIPTLACLIAFLLGTGVALLTVHAK